MEKNNLSSILSELGVDLSSDQAAELLAKLKQAAKSEASSAAEELVAKKKANFDKVCELAKELRYSLANAVEAADLLPKSVLSFTIRVGENGEVSATANDCASAFTQERIHVTRTGTVLYGEQGKEAAKNKRFRAVKK